MLKIWSRLYKHLPPLENFLIRAVFQIFYDATMFFFRSTLNLAMVIPAMDHIDECLSNDVLNSTFKSCVCATASLAKKTLNQYYNKTDHTDVYQIAMDMFLCHLYPPFLDANIAQYCTQVTSVLASKMPTGTSNGSKQPRQLFVTSSSGPTWRGAMLMVMRQSPNWSRYGFCLDPNAFLWRARRCLLIYSTTCPNSLARNPMLNETSWISTSALLQNRFRTGFNGGTITARCSLNSHAWLWTIW